MLSQGSLLQERYRILRQLGQGGMGAVYEATDQRFGTPVALKEIIFVTHDPKQKAYLEEAFEREAKSLATARHECIPYVRDYFHQENSQYLVMELVEGDDLAKMLEERRRPFFLDDGINWMRQLLDALDYLHNLTPPIIHRDIKPQNLKLTSRKRLKLLDFGIAKSGERTGATTQKQTFVGATLDYSPIEQILRVIDITFREFIILKHEEKARAILEQKTDARTDIFAVGGTFYHLLTNHPPRDATKRTLEVWEGKPDPLVHPSELNPAIPHVFGDFLLTAMAIERDERFSTAAEMLEVLNEVAAESLASLTPTQAKTVRFVAKPSDKSARHSTDPSRASDIVDLPTVPDVQIVSAVSGASPFANEMIVADSEIPETVNSVPVEKSVDGLAGREKAQKKSGWIIPVIAGLILLVGFIVGSVMLLPNVFPDNKVFSNTAVTPVSQSPTPANSQVVVQVTPLPVTNTSSTNTIENKIEKAKPTVAKREEPTAQRKLKTNPAKPVSKPSQNLDCLLTNTCGK